MSVDVDQSWTARAACAKESPDDLFVQGAAQRLPREICFSCAVRTQCLAHALDHRIYSRVWGRLTERERLALLRRGSVAEQRCVLFYGTNGHELDALSGQRWAMGRNCRNFARLSPN